MAAEDKIGLLLRGPVEESQLKHLLGVASCVRQRAAGLVRGLVQQTSSLVLSARSALAGKLGPALAVLAGKLGPALIPAAAAILTVAATGVGVQAAVALRKRDQPVEPAFHKLLAQRTQRLPAHAASSGAPGVVLQVVLTGGPMGGKASLAARLSRQLGERGWRSGGPRPCC